MSDDPLFVSDEEHHMTASDTTSSTLSGIGVSPGLVAGPVARMAPPIPEPEIATLEASRDIEKECERIALAAQQVKKGLELSAAEAKAEARTLLETTAQMAADPTLTSTAQAMVREKRLVPERAVWESAGTLAAMLESLGGYMAERTRDVQDVRDRIVAVLTESPMPGIPRLPEPFVLVAADLAPADTALLDPEKVIAFITSEGGPTSHTAILARALGMPAIVGTGEEVTDALAEGDIVLVDGTKGTITINPSEDALRRARELASRVRVFNGDGATKDGHEVQLLANVGDATGARSAAEAGAMGIGLFRTEFCFLDQPAEPTGEAEITPGFHLPARHVLHTVGPIVSGRLTDAHRAALASSYRSCLGLAASHGLRTVALCCVSTGVFGFPQDQAARIAVSTTAAFLDSAAPGASRVRVVFDVFGARDEELYRRELGL